MSLFPQQAMNFLMSSIAVLDGSMTFCPAPFGIGPREAGTAPPDESFMSRAGRSCAKPHRMRLQIGCATG
jgi:hypothetical protein